MYTFNDLVDIVSKLRGEGGCPWDREQTYESLKRYVIEEAYEVIDEVDGENKLALADELGDLLLQVVMYAQVGKETGDFSIDTVLDCVCNKMITRHPHVFGDAKADNPDEVLKLWGEIKKKEKGQKTQSEAMRGISASMPSLLRAQKVQEAAAKVGFDWADIDGAFEKLEEETKELKEETPGTEKFAEELGDLLFSVVNISRFAKVQPELALKQGTDKFISRFELVEQEVIKSGRKMMDMSLAELDEIWDRVKKDR